jgi:hypothetical protein
MCVSSSAAGRSSRGRLGVVVAALAAVAALVAGGFASAALLGDSAKGVTEEFIAAYVDGDCKRVGELSVPRRREYLHGVCEQNAGEWQARGLEVSGATTDQDRATVPVRLEVRQRSGDAWGPWQPGALEVELQQVEGDWLVEDVDGSGR